MGVKFLKTRHHFLVERMTHAAFHLHHDGLVGGGRNHFALALFAMFFCRFTHESNSLGRCGLFLFSAQLSFHAGDVLPQFADAMGLFERTDGFLQI